MDAPIDKDESMKIMRKIAVEGQASQTLFEVLSLSPLHNVSDSVYAHIYVYTYILIVVYI